MNAMKQNVKWTILGIASINDGIYVRRVLLLCHWCTWLGENSASDVSGSTTFHASGDGIGHSFVLVPSVELIRSIDGGWATWIHSSRYTASLQRTGTPHQGSCTTLLVNKVSVVL